MGMFDRVMARCPKCGRQVEFQSRLGPCVLAQYSLGAVPAEVAADLHNKSETCVCGTMLTLKSTTTAMVPMHVVLS